MLREFDNINVLVAQKSLREIKHFNKSKTLIGPVEAQTDAVSWQRQTNGREQGI